MLNPSRKPLHCHGNRWRHADPPWIGGSAGSLVFTARPTGTEAHVGCYGNRPIVCRGEVVSKPSPSPSQPSCRKLNRHLTLWQVARMSLLFGALVGCENNNNGHLRCGKTVAAHGMLQRVWQQWCGKIDGIFFSISHSWQSLSVSVYKLPDRTTVWHKDNHQHFFFCYFSFYTVALSKRYSLKCSIYLLSMSL